MPVLKAGLWVSPWRVRVRNGKRAFVCDVARSRKSAERIQAVVAADDYAKIPDEKRRSFMANVIVEAARELGIVQGEPTAAV